MGEVHLALEYLEPVLKCALSKLRIPLLGFDSAFYQRLEALRPYSLLSGLLYQILHQGTTTVGIPFKYLNSVLKDALGKGQIFFLGGNSRVRNCLVCLLDGIDQNSGCLIYVLACHDPNPFLATSCEFIYQ